MMALVMTWRENFLMLRWFEEECADEGVRMMMIRATMVGWGASMQMRKEQY